MRYNIVEAIKNNPERASMRVTGRGCLSKSIETNKYREYGQSYRHSILESWTNILTGMLIAFTLSQLAHAYEHEIQRYIWEGFTWKLSVGSNVVMTSIITVFSFIRNYCVRRFFNSLTSRYK